MRVLWIFAVAIASFAVAIPAQDDPKKEAKKPTESVASLGVETRAPTKEECVRYALELEVRYKGQLVTDVVEKSAAAVAGIEVGDIILKMGKVEVFSADDIADILMVREPGQVLDVRVLVAKTKKQRSVLVKLGSKEIPRRNKARLTWHYAGLPYLEDALARAKKEKRRVLVGLSGAGT